MKTLFMIVIGGCFGILSSAGAFTVLAAVGLVPRFAGKTHTASKILTYEEMVVYGAITGCLVSIYPEYCQFAAWWQLHFPQLIQAEKLVGMVCQIVIGSSSGMFVGCLALAIAEMLESIPIFTRRVSFRHGLGWAVMSIAAGKVVGALLYFLTDFHRTVM